MNAIDEIGRRYHETRRAVAAYEPLRRKNRRIDLTLAAITLLVALAALAVAHALWTSLTPGCNRLCSGSWTPSAHPALVSLAAPPISPKL